MSDTILLVPVYCMIVCTSSFVALCWAASVWLVRKSRHMYRLRIDGDEYEAPTAQGLMNLVSIGLKRFEDHGPTRP